MAASTTEQSDASRPYEKQNGYARKRGDDAVMANEMLTHKIANEDGGNNGLNGRTTPPTVPQFGDCPSKRPPVHIKKHPIRGKLSMLPGLPLDILFSIFCLLSPKDLVYLARTNKLFRSTLRSKNAKTVWVSSRQILGYGAPDPPEDLTETYWSWFLFDTKCCVCLARSVHSIDFGLRRRYCKKCCKDCIIAESALIHKPNYDVVLSSLILRSTNQPRFQRIEPYFWREDAEIILRRIQQFKQSIEKNEDHAHEMYENFKEDRIRYVKKTNEHSKLAEVWYNRMESEKTAQTSETRKEREAAIKDRLKEMGYHEHDLSVLDTAVPVRRLADLTEHGWAMMRPNLENLVMQQRSHRIKRLYPDVVEDRSIILTTIYRDYVKTLNPSEWITCPHPSVIESTFAALNPVIFAEEEVDITRDDFKDVEGHLAEYIATWQAKRTKAMLAVASKPADSVLPASITKACSTSLYNGQIANPRAPVKKPTPDFTELAISVFCCTCKAGSRSGPQGRPEPLFGKDGVYRHTCHPDSLKYTEKPFEKLNLHPDAPNVVAEILTELKMAKSSTTFGMLDELDKRFICAGCEPEEYDARSEIIRAYSWRDYVHHFCETKHGCCKHRTPKFTVLDEIREEKVKEAELNSHWYQHTQWSCKYCNVHFENYKPRQFVFEHLMDSHSIQKPANKDVVLMLGQQAVPTTMGGCLIVGKSKPNDSRLVHRTQSPSPSPVATNLMTHLMFPSPEPEPGRYPYDFSDNDW